MGKWAVNFMNNPWAWNEKQATSVPANDNNTSYALKPGEKSGGLHGPSAVPSTKTVTIPWQTSSTEGYRGVKDDHKPTYAQSDYTTTFGYGDTLKNDKHNFMIWA